MGLLGGSFQAIRCLVAIRCSNGWLEIGSWLIYKYILSLCLLSSTLTDI